MGNLGQSLLEVLGASQQTGSVGGVPPEAGGLGGMTEAVMGFPSVARGGISEAGALPGGMEPEVDAVVRGFKPKKISFWGALGDQLLKHWGNEPAFGPRIQQKNMRRAMEGFTHDPKEAIARLAQIPGMEQKAWELFDKQQDNEAAQKRFELAYGTAQEKTLKGAAGLAAIALKHPPSRKSAIARYNQILRSKGLDEYTLDDDVGDEVLAAVAGGAIPPDKQEQNELRRIRLEQTGADTQSKIRDREIRHGQTERKMNQTDRRLNIQQQNANKPGGSRGKPQPRVVMTPGGNQFTIHPSGLAGVLMRPDGTTIEMVRFGNGWKIRPSKPEKTK